MVTTTQGEAQILVRIMLSPVAHRRTITTQTAMVVAMITATTSTQGTTRESRTGTGSALGTSSTVHALQTTMARSPSWRLRALEVARITSVRLTSAPQGNHST